MQNTFLYGRHCIIARRDKDQSDGEMYDNGMDVVKDFSEHSYTSNGQMGCLSVRLASGRMTVKVLP
ncbi:hypothetical protein D3C79_1100130 [compost metagenome]